ncbi:aspartyl protease family protein [Gaetbulibacter sp. M235]|uniref:aspartyl protease family protein n=1 Tax=Gaetbulibacter sp. M235 TaxID=3126510 RepID=UPI00374F8BA8
MLRCFIILLICVHSVFAVDDTFNSIKFYKAEIINSNTTRIPFKLIDHLIVVEAELLNKKGNFIIDTGSETLILNKSHFQNLYQHNKKENETYGILSVIDTPFEKNLKEFALQDFKLFNTNSDIIDLSHIERSKNINLLGIIGFSILKDYEVFIDFYLNQITLSKIDASGNKIDTKVYLEKIVDSVNFKLKNHTIILNATINKQNVKFGLDSGAEFNQINKNVNKKILKHFIPKRRLLLSGAGNKKIEVLAGKLYRVKLSETVYLGPMYTVLTNLSNMNEAFGTNLDGILGYEFFKRKRTIINYQKEKIYFIDFPRTAN